MTLIQKKLIRKLKNLSEQSILEIIDFTDFLVLKNKRQSRFKESLKEIKQGFVSVIGDKNDLDEHFNSLLSEK
ncbi:MAG: hypothetical protein A2Y41_01905 [Spirochaetes bacterium GWB1_36_13]|nr:MAG: hypothetical protein A2Y41_01905 [Spirochaetes bacterium GWB1_36_13]